MSEMIEQVAKALFEKHHRDKLEAIRSGKISASMSGIEYYYDGWEGQDESAKAYMRAEARAAIGAMREPTEAMIDAGVTAETGGTLGSRIANCHRAMIDAALAEGTEAATTPG